MRDLFLPLELIHRDAEVVGQPGIEALLREFRDRTYGRRETLTVGETAGLTPETLLSFISLKDGVF